MTEQELSELRACRAVGRQIRAAQRQPASAPAPMPSYTMHLLLVMGLYWLGWLPGFIANLLILPEAEAAERRAGVPLPGVAGLRFLFVFTRGLFILVVLALVIGLPILWGLAAGR